MGFLWGNESLALKIRRVGLLTHAALSNGVRFRPTSVRDSSNNKRIYQVACFLLIKILFIKFP